MSMKEIIRCARGDMPADLLLTGGNVLNVFSGEILSGDIAIKNGTIVGIGDYQSIKRADIKGATAVPGFIDAHVHIESSMTGVDEFAQAVLPHGTTTVIADPHEIANVSGTEGIRYMLDTSAELKLNVFFMLSSCVPATDMETTGARLTADELRPFIHEERILGLAEMMNFPGVISADEDVLSKIHMARGARKPIDGHSPGLSGHHLSAYVAAGITSDHECTSHEEAREKLRAGMHIMVREGSAAKNLSSLLPVVDPVTYRRMMWCTDDRHPHDLLNEGHIDYIVRNAVRLGLDPVIAIQMATLNPTEYFNLKHLGAIAPGRQADILIIDNLKKLNIVQVYSRGQLVADGGRMLDTDGPQKPIQPPRIMNVQPDRIDFSIPAHSRSVRVIDIIPNQIVTRALTSRVRIENGLAVSDPDRDLLKIAVVDRYSGTGRIGLGFVKGLGLKKGAIASSVAHDSHNIILAGADDRDLSCALRTIVDMGGGLAAVSNEEPLAVLPLPIGGLMSDAPIEKVCQHIDVLLQVAVELGSPLVNPFMTLSFLALPVIPQLKITDHGLVDVNTFQFVPLFKKKDL
jgi:adenine deaminase